MVWSPDGEGQSVRQYRYLLRTAPLDALEEAHVEVLGTMETSLRAAVLAAVQDGLVAGLRLGPGDVRRIAHLLSLGERRRPGDFLRACPIEVLLPLARGVIVAEAMYGRFGGYADWDGAEPVLEAGVDDSEYAQGWHAARSRVIYQGLAGPDSADNFGLGGTGGG